MIYRAINGLIRHAIEAELIGKMISSSVLVEEVR